MTIKINVVSLQHQNNITMKTSTTYTERLSEFKVLNSKRNLSKGYTQGLTNDEYFRINNLHAYLLSVTPELFKTI